jgi:tyrosinase
MAIIRKNQKDLTPKQWDELIQAIMAIQQPKITAPRYRDFVRVHVRAMSMTSESMAWAVHSMGPTMRGRNFLAWHRQFLFRFEKRLRKVNPNVSLPYWNAVANRRIPAQLNAPDLVEEWGVTREWDATELTTQAVLDSVMKIPTFTAFQSALENTVHATVHIAVGGTMSSSSSPADPIFWLHHANIDRLWAKWQAGHLGQNPPNMSETLQPKPILGVKVSRVVRIKTLGYSYE